MDRIAQCVRHITARTKREFRSNAKLLELAVRNLAIFASRSKEAQALASEIQLVPEEPTHALPTASTATPERRVILPPGVDVSSDADEGAQRYKVFTEEEVPDDSTRKKVNVGRENKDGSYENILNMFSRSTG